MITGIKQATVPVLDDTEDSTMVTSMIAAMSGISFVPAFLTTDVYKRQVYRFIKKKEAEKSIKK